MSKRQLAPLLVSLALVILSLSCTAAATYKLPVRTATFATDVEYYGLFTDGQPAGPYDFYIDPPTLRVGYDHQSGLVYESAIIFDWNEFAVRLRGWYPAKEELAALAIDIKACRRHNAGEAARQ